MQLVWPSSLQIPPICSALTQPVFEVEGGGGIGGSDVNSGRD